MLNRSTAVFVRVQGIMVGTLGAIHGASAALKGYVSTNGFVMATIGAVTVIPNYLVTGVVAILVGVCVVLWTVFCIHKSVGPTVFLVLCVLLVAVGGGIAHIPFFVISWAISTRINRPLSWWRKVSPEGFAFRLAPGWLADFVVCYSFLLVGIAVWLVFLTPGSTSRPLVLQYVCWSLIAAGLLMQAPTIVAGFMRDLQRRATTDEQ